MSSTKKSCKQDEDIGLRRGPWTLEEDTLLVHYIATHGEGRWNHVARFSGLKRTGKSCRLRWLNYLNPDVKRGNLTPEEQLVILELHSKWGNRWSKIAQHLPGRTDNEIKNYWRTRVQKQARQLKIDANSSRFRDAIRWFWVPRLLQKMASPYSSTFQPLNSTPILLNVAPQASPSPPEYFPTSHSNTPISYSDYSQKSISNDCRPSISSNPMNTIQLPQIPEFPTCSEDFAITERNPILKDCVGSYDLEALHVAFTPEAADFNYTLSDFSIIQSTCFDDLVIASPSGPLTSVDSF